MILVLYTVFITACGWTHFFDALMFYNPVYRANGLVRAITAAASVGTAISLVRLMPLAIKAPVTILTQRATLRQQQAWLRDILDSVTDGRLKLCADRSDLPDPLGPEPSTIFVAEPNDLRGLRKIIRDAAARAGFNPSQGHALLSSVHEAAMNALVHAGAATIRCDNGPNRVQIWIEDTGPGIPWTNSRLPP
jgi:hypothetical protein